MGAGPSHIGAIRSTVGTYPQLFADVLAFREPGAADHRRTNGGGRDGGLRAFETAVSRSRRGVSGVFAVDVDALSGHAGP
ncbi:hypothetical protein D3C80_1983350 [compost metagenome]